MSETEERSNSLILNTAIGFLSLLLLVLLFALTTRVLYPRIVTSRSQDSEQLIGNIIQIEVLNGCGVSGLATKFTQKLRRHGFDVVETGNFDNFDMAETYVIARSSDTENAERVASALGLDKNRVVQEVSPDYYLDATVVIGSDYENINLK